MIAHRLLLAVGALSLLSSCSMFGSSDQIVPGHGYVVADEPQAARVGAAILAHGGNAADAAVATYLALSVTYPVAAGLGGGGACVVHAGQSDKTLEFLPRKASRGGSFAVPGNISGFSRLQSLYGRLPWQRVVSPAESFAAAGFKISKALEERLSESANVVRLDAALAAEFLDESGNIKPAESSVVAPAVAQTLSAIRTAGPEAFYRGAPANQLLAYSSSQGGAISAADLAGFAPEIASPQMVRIDDMEAYLPPASAAAGRFAGAVLSHVLGTSAAANGGDELAKAVISASDAIAREESQASPQMDLGETGFVAADNTGMAVACGVTMNGPFGSGRTVPSLGVTLANAPSSGALGLFLTPLVAVSDGELSLAGAGTGGPQGSAAILLALLQMAHGGDIVRPGVLRPTGREPLQTVNIVACQKGICVASADPRGSGLGAGGY